MTYNGNHLFHYTKFDSALKIISSRKLLFGDFRNVNDISESRRDIIGDYDIAMEELNKYKAICFIRDDGEYRGFAIDSLWGYYAEKGNGVCLVYDKRKLMERFKLMQCFHKYGNIRYIKNFTNGIVIEEKGDEVRDEIKRKYRDIFFTKSRDWSKEKEFRLLIQSLDEDDSYLCCDEALVAVIICMPLFDNIKDTCEYDILSKIVDVPILQYRTFLGKKALINLEGDDKEELWPVRDDWDIYDWKKKNIGLKLNFQNWN